MDKDKWIIVALIIVFVIILVIVLCVWVLPAISTQNSTSTSEPKPSSSSSSANDYYTVVVPNSTNPPSGSSNATQFLFSNGSSSSNVLKIAFCIGIDYIGTEYMLQTCGNDMKHIGEFCKTKLGILPANIYFMTDRTNAIPSWNVNSTYNPTVQQLSKAFFDLLLLIPTNQPCEICWFYSGHGSYFSSLDSKESDHQDEYIIMKDGAVKDDVIQSEFLALLPSTCKMFCLFDCCYSGTATDLKYIYNSDQKQSQIDEKYSKTTAKVVMMSASQDHQVAYGGISTTDLSVLTKVFLQNFAKGYSFITLQSQIQNTLTQNFVSQAPVLTASMSELFTYGLIPI
jgi:hypothetical protein